MLPRTFLSACLYFINLKLTADDADHGSRHFNCHTWLRLCPASYVLNDMLQSSRVYRFLLCCLSLLPHGLCSRSQKSCIAPELDEYLVTHTGTQHSLLCRPDPECIRVMQVDGIRSNAMFILLVEKDAAFMRLAEDRFYRTYPCIIMTAKGQPDVASR